MTTEHNCIRVLVNMGGNVTRPTTRAELEAALDSKAVAETEHIGSDAEWQSGNCFCVLDPGATAHKAKVECDPNPRDPETDLYFFK